MKEARLKIEQRRTADLVPYARNARTHSEAQVDQIAASIREFGFTNPVLVDASGGIIAGHGRVLAAKKLGIARVPVIALGHLTEQQKRAYIIADNKLALNAGWDAELLAAELRDLQAADFDLDLIGFSGDELAALCGTLSDEPRAESASLAEQFGVPPFSVLDARQGYWQARKAAWLALGIESELGRGGCPGGSPRPAAQLTAGGVTQRGDGRGRAIA